MAADTSVRTSNGVRRGIDRHRARTEAPERQQFREEFEPVAEMQEDPVAAADAAGLEPRNAGRYLAPDLPAVPAPAAHRLDEITDA